MAEEATQRASPKPSLSSVAGVCQVPGAIAKTRRPTDGIRASEGKIQQQTTESPSEIDPAQE